MNIRHGAVPENSRDLPHSTKVVPFGNYGGGLLNCLQRDRQLLFIEAKAKSGVPVVITAPTPSHETSKRTAQTRCRGQGFRTLVTPGSLAGGRSCTSGRS